MAQVLNSACPCHLNLMRSFCRFADGRNILILVFISAYLLTNSLAGVSYSGYYKAFFLASTESVPLAKTANCLTNSFEQFPAYSSRTEHEHQYSTAYFSHQETTFKTCERKHFRAVIK